MSVRTAFVDDVQAAKDFATDDVVRKTDFRGFFPSPYAGRVTYVDRRNGTVIVQWPWGSEQEYPTELIRDTSGDVMPPVALDQGYSTWEESRWRDTKEVQKADAKWLKKLTASVVSKYESDTLPLWRAACKAHHAGLHELEALRTLSSEFSGTFGQNAVLLTVANLYEAGRSVPARIALYWKDKGRRYKVTQREKSAGKLKCPRCSSWGMKPRTYRHNKKVLTCQGCGFSISPKDLMWDDSSPVEPAQAAPASPVASLLSIAATVSNPLLGYELEQAIRRLSADEDVSSDEHQGAVNPGVMTWQKHVEEMLTVLKSLDQELGSALSDLETAEEFAKFFEGGISEEEELKSILQRTVSLGKVASRTAASDETSGFSDFWKKIKKTVSPKDKPDAAVMDKPGYALSDKALDEFVEGSREWLDASKYVESEFKENKAFFDGVHGVLSDMDKMRESPSRDGVRALRDRVMKLVKMGKGVLDGARSHFNSPKPSHTKDEEQDVDLGWTVQHYIEMLKESLSDPAKMRKYLKEMFDDVGPSLRSASSVPARAEARRRIASVLVRLAQQRPSVRPVVLPVLRAYAGR